jgi:hypothetical protein
MTMISTGSSVMRALVLASVVTSACIDPAVDEVQPPPAGSTSANGSTTQPADGSTAPTPEGPGSEGLDESADGPVLTSTDGTGITTVELDSTTGGDPTTGDSTTGDATMGDATTGDTGSSANPHEGSYGGAWSGNCPVIGGVAGTMTFAVAADGTLTGSISGSDSGPLVGTVDGAGVVDSVATGMIAGSCPFNGQIDGAGYATGMWFCAVGCSGVWSAQ